MNVRGAASLGLLLPGILVASMSVAAAKTAPPAKTAAKAGATHAAAPAAPARSIEHGPYLPDTLVLCSVGPRKTTVADYVRLWFSAYVPDRPDNDSTGRATFLANIVTKDILGQVANEVNRPFQFEDRAQMREVEERSLSNALYKSAVLDSLNVTDADIAREYETYQYEVRMRHIMFPDLATAQRVRVALVGGRTTWQQAYDRYSLSKGKDKGPDGELGWTVRGGAPLDMSRKIFRLNAGAYSEPIEEPEGWSLVQVVEKRPGSPPSLKAVSSFLRQQLADEQTEQRGHAVRDLVRAQIGMTYDSTAIAWSASHFTPAHVMDRDENGVTNYSFDPNVPEFQPSDTSRVLARYRDGVLTLGRFLHLYTDIQPLTRPNIDTPAAFRDQIDGFVFEPYMAQVARERGLAKDSMVVAQIANKREQIMVEHLYSDSVLSRVSITSDARRKYYKEHPADFTTYPQVRYAALWADSKEKADQYAARLKGGESAADIIHADSLLGQQRGSIQTRGQNEHGPYQKLLMEELRPGQVTVEGPDKEGHYTILQSLEYIPGRLLSYDEAATYVDDTLQSLEAERMLKAFVDRHRKKYPIQSRPELVMRIHLVDPTI